MSKCSSQPSTPTSSPCIRSQAELFRLMQAQIGNQTWQFPPDTVAQMLSPKQLKHDCPQWSRPPRLEDADCLVDHPFVRAQLDATAPVMKGQFQGWSKTHERPNYKPLTQLLNDCVGKCNSIYGALQDHLASTKDSRWKIVPQDERLWPHLKFVEYDKATGDGIEGAHSLKPDFYGVGHEGNMEDDFICYWSLASVQGQNRAAVEGKQPGEVKKIWPALLRQAATYARAATAAAPLRAFSVVIGYTHSDNTLRFLIFHRGGVSATEALHLDQEIAGRAMLKVMLSIVLWQSPEDAGLPSFTDGRRFVFPEPLAGDVYNVDSALYQSVSVRGRGTWVGRLKRQASDSSTPDSTSNLTPRYNLRRNSQVTGAGGPSRSANASGNKSQLGGAANVTMASGNKTGNHSKCLASHATPTDMEQSTRAPPEDDAVRITLSIHNKVPPSAVLTRDMIPPANGVCSDRLGQSAQLIAKCAWPCDEKAEMEPGMYSASSNAFGAPDHLVSFQPCFERGMPMSNSIFLPPPGECEGRFWNVFSEHAPEKPDYRSLWISCLGSEGEHLDRCLNAKDLCECLLHSMLGWLSAYQSGFLHRDISIGNLLKLKQPGERRAFTAGGVCRLLVDLSGGPAMQDHDTGALFAAADRLAQDNEKRSVLVTLARALDAALAQFHLTAECKAMWTDGDMCARMSTYFDEGVEHASGELSGTIEFMSPLLRQAMDLGWRYLQSPNDDMWSFLWTALWATLYNSADRGSTLLEHSWRESLRGSRGERWSVLVEVTEIAEISYGTEGELASIVRAMAPLFRRWSVALGELDKEWRITFAKAKAAPTRESLLLLNHEFAYKGVMVFVTVLSDSGIMSGPS